MSEPVVAAREPVEFEVTEGETYWWCACGRSKNQPFCDGSHEGTGLEPVEYTASHTRRLFFCACKKTGRVPLCDGSHNAL